MQQPCEHCPWRTKNRGKKTPWGFYTKTNLRRLWNEVRGGGKKQSCHPTDPRHPDHVAAGAKSGSKPKECPGSVILILREIRAMSNSKSVVTPESMEAYYAIRRKGLKKPRGVQYWLLDRLTYGALPVVGGGELPEVDIDHPDVSLPEEFSE